MDNVFIFVITIILGAVLGALVCIKISVDGNFILPESDWRCVDADLVDDKNNKGQETISCIQFVLKNSNADNKE
jgi:hypothetical protein